MTVSHRHNISKIGEPQLGFADFLTAEKEFECEQPSLVPKADIESHAESVVLYAVLIAFVVHLLQIQTIQRVHDLTDLLDP